MADGLQPAWQTCSTPRPACPARSGRDPRGEGAAGLCGRGRLALLQGLSRFLAELPGCLPPSSRGRQPLIWAYLLPTEYFLSLFLLQPQANRWGGEAGETGLSEWGLSQGRGPPLRALLLRSVLVLSPNLSTALCVQAPQQPTPTFLACLLLEKHYTPVPWSSKTRLNAKLLGMTYEPLRSLASAAPLSFRGPLFPLPRMTARSPSSPFESQL